MKNKGLIILIITILLSALLSLSTTVSASANIEIGDYFMMGTYYGQPILWRCVDIDENGPLMLSDKIICLKPYDASGENWYGSHGNGYADAWGHARYGHGSDYWGDSNMRCWLNSDANSGNVEWECDNPPTGGFVYPTYCNTYATESGFLTNFTSGERNLMKSVTQKSVLNKYEENDGWFGGVTQNSNYHRYSTSISTILQNYDTAYSEYVTDKMFLLDVKQLYNVYNNGDILGKDYYIGEPTVECVENNQTTSTPSVGKKWSYWLRTPNASDEGTRVRVVFSDGTVEDSYAKYGMYGVRPAFYLNLSHITFLAGEGSERIPYVDIDNNKRFEEIAVNYPEYLNPQQIENRCGKLEEFCYTAIKEHAEGDDIKKLAFAEGFFNGGAEIVFGELLSFITGRDTGDEWLMKSTIEFLQEISSSNTVVYDTWDAINKGYNDFKFIYDVSDNINKANLAKEIVRCSYNITESEAIDIVTKGIDKYEGFGFDYVFDKSGKAFDFVDVALFACQLYEFDMELIDRLLSVAPQNSSLREGLTMVKSEREKNVADFVIKTFMKDQIVDSLKDQVMKFGKYVTAASLDANISITMAVTQLVMKVFYEYAYDVKVTDIYNAIIAREFYLTMYGNLIKLQTNIIRAHNNNEEVSKTALEEYEIFWDYRIAALSYYAKKCAIISDDKVVIETYNDDIKKELEFEQYVSYCLDDVRDAISSGTIQCVHYIKTLIRTSSATCTTQGYNYSCCLTCLEDVNEIFPILPHTYQATVVSPLCIRQGYTRYTCSSCNTYYDADYITDPDNHRFRVATCTVPKTCLYCKTTSGEALGHTYDNDCDTSCNTCSALREVSEHIYDVIVVRPTLYSRGYTRHTCTVCGYMYRDNYTDPVSKPTIFVENISIGETTSFTVELISPIAITGKLLIATYNGNKFKNLMCYDATLTRDITINSNDFDAIKIMWWNDLLSFCPMAHSEVINCAK